jgi:hypothetical protein
MSSIKSCIASLYSCYTAHSIRVAFEAMVNARPWKLGPSHFRVIAESMVGEMGLANDPLVFLQVEEQEDAESFSPALLHSGWKGTTRT